MNCIGNIYLSFSDFASIILKKRGYIIEKYNELIETDPLFRNWPPSLSKKNYVAAEDLIYYIENFIHNIQGLNNSRDDIYHKYLPRLRMALNNMLNSRLSENHHK